MADADAAARSFVFISDLHLEDAEGPTARAFTGFCREIASKFDALYILGDLFEAWIGDDSPGEIGARCAETLRDLGRTGTAVSIMRGNRDFLMGRTFADQCAARLLPDALVVSLGGEPTLLLHGDTLCTDDDAYQRVRCELRSDAWQQAFLARPIADRQAFAASARSESRAYTSTADLSIMDVNEAAVATTMQQFGVGRLIHGHTHRPADHQVDAGGQMRRHVLAAWHDAPDALAYRPESGLQRLAL